MNCSTCIIRFTGNRISRKDPSVSDHRIFLFCCLLLAYLLINACPSPTAATPANLRSGAGSEETLPGGPSMVDIRTWQHSRYYRVVIEVSSAVVPSIATMEDPPEISMFFPGVASALEKDDLEIVSLEPTDRIEKITAGETGGGVAVRIFPRSPDFKYVWSVLSLPYRFYVDISPKSRLNVPLPVEPDGDTARAVSEEISGDDGAIPTGSTAMERPDAEPSESVVSASPIVVGGMSGSRVETDTLLAPGAQGKSLLYHDPDLSRVLTFLTVDSLKVSLSDSALYFAAVGLLNRSWYDMSVYYFSYLIENHLSSPYAVRAAIGIGQAYYQAGIYEKSSEIFDRILRALSVGKEEVLVRYHLALSLLREEKFEKALVELQTIRDKYATQFHAMAAHEHLGNCLYRLGDYEEAIVVLRDGIRRSDDLEVIMREWYLIGCCHEAEESLDDAVQAYNHVVELHSCLMSSTSLDDIYKSAMLKIPDCHYMLEDYMKAQNAYARYLGRFPSDENLAWVLYQVANCQIFQEKFCAAKGTFTELIRLEPGSYWSELAKWESNYIDWLERFTK